MMRRRRAGRALSLPHALVMESLETRAVFAGFVPSTPGFGGGGVVIGGGGSGIGGVSADAGDTLATATSVQLVNDSFATAGTIGDGDYGTSDVDMYRLDVAAGASVVARVQSQATMTALASALRVFDQSGAAVAIGRDIFGFGTSSVSFGSPAGGTYYFAVSGAPNDGYDPTVATGRTASSTGGYRLSVTAPVDTTPPVVSLGQPAAISTYPTTTVSVSTSETVAGLDLGDFTLTRDGTVLPLTGAQFTEGYGGYQQLSLADIATRPGTYVLTFTAAGSGVIDAVGNAAVTNATISWTVTTPSGFASGPRGWAAVLTAQAYGNCNVTAVGDGPDGTTFVAGSFFGTVAFDPAHAASTRTSSGGAAFVAMYGPSGGLLDVVVFGEGASVTIGGVAADAAGGLVVAGRYQTYGDTTVDLDPTAGSLPVSGTGLFVARLDPATQTLSWLRRVTAADGADGSVARIAARPGGGIVVAASFTGALTVGSEGSYAATETPVTLTTPTSGTGPAYDVGLVAYAADGSLAWARQLGAQTNASASALVVGPAGVTMAGWFTGLLTSPGAGGSLDAGTGRQGFAARYRADGSLAWVVPVDGDGDPAVATDAEVVGVAIDPATGDSLVTVNPSSSSTAAAALLRLAAADGASTLVRTFAGSGGQTVRLGSVRFDAAGAIRVGGIRMSARMFGMPGGSSPSVVFIAKLGATEADDATRSFTAPNQPLSNGDITADGGLVGFTRLGYGEGWRVPGADPGIVAASSGGPLVMRLADPFAADQPTAVIAPVATPRQAGIDSAVVTFTAAVDGVDVADFRLWRDGAAVPLPAGISVSSTDGIAWTLSGLSSATAADGIYVLALVVGGSGIQTQGTALPLSPFNDPQLRFTVDATPPTATLAAWTYVAPVDGVDVTFSEPVSGLAAAAFLLDGQPLPVSASVSRTSSDGRSWQVTGLSVAATVGRHVLTLSAAAATVVDAAGNRLAADATADWTNPAIDLVVTGLAVVPTAPAAGGALTIRWYDTNVGDGDSPYASVSDRVQVVNRTTGQTLLDTTVFNSFMPIAAGGSSFKSYTFYLPTGANGVGTLDITVTADTYGSVSETNAAGTGETNNSATISVTSAAQAAPDLTVTGLAVAAQSSLQSGGFVTINWTDTNAGTAAVNYFLYDRVRVVNTTTGQTLVDDYPWQYVSLAAGGGSVARSYSFTLPNGPAGVGSLAITVTTDAFNLFAESNAGGTAETNNSATITTNSTLAPYPDLTVTGLAVSQATLAAGGLMTIQWNDANTGDGATAGGWYDSIRVVNTTTGETLVDTVAYNGDVIAAGGSLARQYSFTLPQGRPGAGTLSIQITADAYFYAFESNAAGTAETNNSAAIAVTSILPPADLTVTGLAVAQASLQSGGLITVNWTDTNAGTADVTNSVFYDRIRVVNTTTGQTLVDDSSVGPIYSVPAGSGVARSYSFTLPDGPAGAGSLAITVTTDTFDGVAESNGEGTAETNNSAAITVTSALPDYPDLVVRDLAIDPQALQSSHGFTVTWNDVNIGKVAVSRPGPGSDRVRIVNTTTGETLADLTVPTAFMLAVGESRANSYTFALPDGRAGAGQIRVSVTADDYPFTTDHGAVYESNADGTGESNNTAVIEAMSTVPDYPDLVVTGLVFDPPALQSGSPVTVRWNDVNLGRGATYAEWQDTIRVFNRTTGQQILEDAVYSTAAIPAGGTANRTYSFNLPEDAAGVGAIEVTVTADGYPAFGHGSLYESNDEGTAETNNSATITGTSTLVLCPDLVVSAVVSPARGFSGRDAQITWTITNQGTADFSGSLRDAVILAPSPTDVVNRFVLGEFQALLSLPMGGSVTRTQQVALPVGREGSWYVGVITDVFNAAHEHGGESNNLSFAATPIVLQTPPTPNLVISSVTAPPTALSSDQTVVAWTVTNTGTGPTNAPIWYDRVYLSADDVLDSTDLLLGRQQNQSYLAPGESYASSLAVTLPRGINGPYRFIVVTDADNAVSEGANEGDNWRAAEATAVQLTPPPDLQVASVRGPTQAFSGQPIQVSWTVTNAGAGRTLENAWDDQVFLSSDDTFDGSDVFLGTFRHSGTLVAGDSYTTNASVTLPVGVSGNSYLFVFTDARREVFQHVFVNNDVGHSAALNVLLTPPPDLVVSAVKAPASAEAGRGLAINYTVTNDGATKTPDGSGSWTDRIYLSADRTLDAGDLLLIERLHDSWLGLGPGSSYSESFNAVLPATLTGTYYVIVQADAGGRVFELDRGNDVGVTAVPVAVTFQPADLVVQPGSVTAPATASAGGSMQVGFTVRNAGPGATVATAWRDRVVLSGDSVLGNGDDLVLETVIHTGGLAAGAAYTTRAVPVQIPLSVVPGGYTLFVVADNDREVFEYPAGAEANNASAGLPITISRTTADLQLSAVSLDKSTVTSGDTLTVGWTVTNAGAAATNAESWFDRVVLQPVGAGPAIELGTFQHNDPLAGGGSYAVSRTLVVPADIQGSYRVVVTTDYGDRVIEGSGETNNDGVPQPLEVVARPLPNLVVTNVSAPADGYAGQLITVSWTVANVGSAAATGKMFDVVYLSLDQTLDSGDLPLGYGSGDAIISPGGHYTWTLQFRLPQGVTGPFHLIVATDAAAQIRESDETDNSRCDIDPTVVTLMPPADLVVGTITVPATGVPGSTVSIAYTVRNDGANPADGSWRDSLYLSTDDKWDVQDVLLGSVDVAATVPGNGGSYTRTLDAPAPGVNPGSYRVIVRSDIRNTLPEQSETNNLAASLDSVAFDVAGLDLATVATGTLAAGASAYYKVVVPADGQTLRFTFDSLAVAGAAQVFVRYGAMPSPNRFDAASTSPFDAHQTLTAPADRAGTYYVLVTSRSGSGGYSLRADLVPFAVTAVDSSAGGNKGEFTVKVSGSKFQQGTDFELVSAAGTEFMAVRKVVQDSVTAYVTFDMTSAAPGAYTLRAINGATVASLAAPFFVQASVGADVVLGLVAPDIVLQTTVVSVQVNYANRGNQDTIAPLILVESLSTLPIGLTGSQMTASAPLQILGVSPDGPWNRLRPGSLGSAFVTCTVGGFDDPEPKLSVSLVSDSASRPISSDEWTTIERSIRPVGVGDMQWAGFWDGIRARIGTTWGQYVRFLNRVLDAVGEPGGRNQDVRALVGRLIDMRPGYLPSLTADGRILDSTSGAPVAGLSIDAYRNDGGRLVLAATATSAGDGGFRFAGLQPGAYTVAIGSAYYLDQDRNGIGDFGSFTFTMAADTDLTGLVMNVASGSTAALPSVIESSALAVDPLGRTHMVYSYHNQIWQSTFDGTGWGPSTVIADEAGTSLTLRAATNVVDGVGAGFVATWAVGVGNDAEIHWSAGRPTTGGGYAWTKPASLTTNHAMDDMPATAVLPDGRVVVVYDRKNAAIHDDQDVYYDLVSVASGAFPAATQDVIRPAGDPGVGGNTSVKYEGEIGALPGLVSVKYGVTVGSGLNTAVSGCTFTRSASGTLSVTWNDGGGRDSNTNLGGTWTGTWTYSINKITKGWGLTQSTFTGAVTLERDFDGGLIRVMELTPLAPEASVAEHFFWLVNKTTPLTLNAGVKISGGISGTATWDYDPAEMALSSTESRSDGEIDLTATLTPYMKAAVKRWNASVTVGGSFGIVYEVIPEAKWKQVSGTVFVDAQYKRFNFHQDLTVSYAFGLDQSSAMASGLQWLDAAGSSEVTWVYDPLAARGTGNVYGGNTVIHDVSTDFYEDGAPAVASTALGAFAAWDKQQPGAIGDDVVVADFNGSAWTAATPIPGSFGLDNDVTAAVDGTGSRLVLWTRSNHELTPTSTSAEVDAARADNDVWYAVRAGDGTWSTPLLLGATAGLDSNLTATTLGDGSVLLAWTEQRDDGSCDLWAARWQDHAWRGVAVVASGSPMSEVSVSEQAGRPFIVWSKFDGVGGNARSSTQFSTFTGTSWAAPATFIPAIVTPQAAPVASSLAEDVLGLVDQVTQVPFFLPPVSRLCLDGSHCEPPSASVSARMHQQVPEAGFDPYKCEWRILWTPAKLYSLDPNDLVAPEGFGADHWIAATGAIPYEIRFENAATATAPVQTLTIRQKLDPDLKPSTFRLGSFGFCGMTFDGPTDSPFYATRLDLMSTLGCDVDVVAGIDVASGEAFWTFTAVDPATGDKPLDPLVGFLPPDDATGRGNGFVNYTIQPRAGLQTGTRLDAAAVDGAGDYRAAIVFDTNAPMFTPAVFNTLDAAAPRSAVQSITAVPAQPGDDGQTPSFTVAWAGTDAESDGRQGSGVASYTVYVSIDGGGFARWLTDTSLRSSDYVGEPGHTYAFYSLATDNAGNVESRAASADASYTTPGGVATIGDFVWHDANGNGIQDAGETGLAGVTVTLHAIAAGTGADTVVGTPVTTGTDGRYTFTNVPVDGQYYVAFTAPAGYAFSQPNAAADDSLDSDADAATGQTAAFAVHAGDNSTWDAGLFRLGSIAGMLWNDVDGDRVRGSGEPALAGWTVFIDANDNGRYDADTDTAAVTDTQGRYTFSGLRPGNFVVSVVVQPGWVETTPGAAGSNSAGTVGLQRTYTFSGSTADLVTPGGVEVNAALSTTDCGCHRTTAGTSTAAVGIPATDTTYQPWADLIQVDAYRADPRFAGIDGRGQTIVFLDTGIDVNHPFFGGDANGDGIDDRIVYQWDFADRDPDASDRVGHGSHVASVAASQDSRYVGVAPGVSIIELKVFGDDGRGSFAYVEQALEWVIQNAARFNVVAVNMSLGDAQNWTGPLSSYGIGDELSTLAGMNVITVAAAGNNYSLAGAPGMAYPAADPNVISVGAVWDGDRGGPWSFGNLGTDYTTGADRIVSFSQRDASTDIFAVGAVVGGANATGGTAWLRGTSMAAPQVTGAAALAQQIAVDHLGRRLSLAELRYLLTSSGTTIVDGDDENDSVRNTGLTFRRLDVEALAVAVLAYDGTLPASSPTDPGSAAGPGDAAAGTQTGRPYSYTVQLAAEENRTNADFGAKQLPAIAVSATTLADLSTTYGTSSLVATFSVSAVGLTPGISLTVTAPTGFEVSLDGTHFGTSRSIVVDALGTVAVTTVSVRIPGTTSAGTYGGAGLDVTVTGGGATSQTVATTVSTVARKALTVTGVTAVNKVYDRTTVATLDTGLAVLSGVISGDTVTLSVVSAAGVFADKNAGVGKSVIVTGFSISGTDSGNYSLSQPSGLTATISPKAIAVTGVTAANKVYDRTTVATLDTGSASLSGVILGDTVTLSVVSAAGAFADKNVSVAKSVTVSGFSIAGTDSGNYSLSQPSGLTANISPKAIAATGVTAANKVYDGTTVATLITGSASLSGVISGDTVTLSVVSATGAFADKNVGIAKSVTVSGFSISGTDGGNYSLTQPSGLSANIAPKSLAVTGATAANKVYDGTTVATISGAALAGVVTGDTVTVSGGGTFASRFAGTGKAVTPALLIAGPASSNYTLEQPTGLTATITPKALTLSGAAAQSRPYDGTTAASITGTLSGVVLGDTVGFVGTGTFAQADRGSGVAVTSNVSLYSPSGSSYLNYAIVQPTGLTADITIGRQTLPALTIGTRLIGTSLTMPAATSAGQPVTYTTSDAAIASVRGNVITFAAAGYARITATAAGTTNYEALSATQTVKVLASADPVTLAAGDVMVLGYDAAGPDSITLLFLKDLTPGTTFCVSDNEVLAAGGTKFVDLAEAEASFTVKSGQVIAAGSVLTLPWAAGTVSLESFDWTVADAAADLAAGGDEIYVYTLPAGGSAGTTTTPAAFISGVAYGASPSARPVGLVDGQTFFRPTGDTMRYKTAGATYAGAPGTLRSAIGNAVVNWEAAAPQASDYVFLLPQPQVVTFAALPSKTYGDATFTLTATAFSGGTVSYTSSDPSVASLAGNVVTILKAGSTVITASVAGNDSYLAASATQPLTVAKKAVAVTADAKQKTYGDSDPALTYVASGLVGADTLSGSLARVAGANVGSYAITAGTLANPNYQVAFTGASLTVNPKALSITAGDVAKAGNQTLVGGAGSTAFTAAGLVAGETVGSVTIGYGAAADPGTAAGTYAGQVTPSAATGGTFAASNYGITYLPGSIVVTSTATISVSPLVLPDLSTTYGTSSIVATFAVSGSTLTQNGSLAVAAPTGFQVSLDGTTFASSRSIAIDSAGTVGTTTVYVRIPGTTAAGTYGGVGADVSVSGGGAAAKAVTTTASTVAKRALTISGLAFGSRAYDGTTSVPTPSAAAFANLANGEIFTPSGAVSWAFADRNVGADKPLVRTGDYAAPSGNYTVAQPTRTASIAAKTLAITADAKTKTYGNADPAFTFTQSGLVPGDTLSGSLSRSSGNGVGAYAINQGTVSAGSNYSIAFTPANLTIAKRAVTITADALSKVAGQVDPALTWKVAAATPLAAGDTAQTAFTGSLVRASGDAQGTYAVSQGTLDAANYQITFVGANFTILPATSPLKITGVFMKGSTWSSGYQTLPIFTTVGATNVGWQLADGATQLTDAATIPWSNVNMVSIRFNQPISAPAVGAFSIVFGGSTAASSATTAMGVPTLLEGGTVAQWTLPASITSGKYRIVATSSMVASASDAGNKLDGEWTAYAGSFAAGSGDGTSGGDFAYDFDVLVGNAGTGDKSATTGKEVMAVNLNDNTVMTGQVGKALSALNFRCDVNGDGKVDSADQTLVQAQIRLGIAASLTSTYYLDPFGRPKRT